MKTFSLLNSMFILFLLLQEGFTCFPSQQTTLPSKITPPPHQLRTATAKLRTTIKNDESIQGFREWGCINERTVKNTATRSTTFNIASCNVSTIDECSLNCTLNAPLNQKYGYMVFRKYKPGIRLENCHCIGNKKNIFFNIYPSDIESVARSDETFKLECENETSFLLSCSQDNNGTLCEKLNEGLKNDPLFNTDVYMFEWSNFFPKCLAKDDINTTMLNSHYQHLNDSTPIITCAQMCGSSYNTTYSIMSKNESNNTMCWCANQTIFQKNTSQGLVTKNDCDKSPTHATHPQIYDIFTFGKYSKNDIEMRYTVYCSSVDTWEGHDRKCHTYNQTGNIFAYFGCVRKPEGYPEPKISTPKDCIEYCNNNQTKPIALIKYINRTNSYCLCLAEKGDEPLEKHAIISMLNISNGCEETWCPSLGGPCGSINSSDGYSVYCKTSTNITQNICKEMADSSNFYPFDHFYPTTTSLSTSTISTTFTTTVRTTTTSTLTTTSLPTSTITTTSTTTLRTTTTSTLITTSLPTSTITTTSTTTVRTTTTSTLTTTTLTPEVTTACTLCSGKCDSRGYYWNQTCSGTHLQFNYCPKNTTGYATWYCYNGQFYPEQPDRTNCIAQWVDDVVEQAQDENSSAMNITNIILDHTSNSTVEITSGTLIKLIEVGLNLSKTTNWNRECNDEVMNISLLITRDYVQITSDLFSKDLSWKEMNSEDQSKHATKLMKSLEGIAYRHLHGISNNSELLPHIENYIGDNRSQVKIYMAVIRKDQKINASMIPPEISLPANMRMQDNSLLHTTLFGATYNFSILRNTLMSADRFYQHNNSGQMLMVNSKPVMTSLSINNKPHYHFTSGRATIRFRHENVSLACQDCKRWCVYWDEALHQWSDHGMSVEKDSNAWYTTCKSDHLTNFAVIFDFTGVHFNGVEEQVLEILSLVFCSASCLCALITLIILNISRLPTSPRISIVKHRSFCLFMLYLLFLVGLDPTKIIIFAKCKELCTTAGILIHFFGLTVFAWTLLEGHQLNTSLQATRITDIDGKYTMLLRYVFGYGAPLVILALTLAVGYIMDGAYNQPLAFIKLVQTMNDDITMAYGVCFLNKDAFIYFFIVPAAIMLFFNSIVFIKAFKAVQEAKKNRNLSKAMSTFIQIKSWFVLNFLLGFTWATGFLFNLPHMQDVAFAFVVLNGSSGIFIFVHTILLNEPIMTEIKVLLGFLDKESFGINHGVNRRNAFKSVKGPIIDRRLKPNDSTSSEEAPPKVARRPRKKRPRNNEGNNVEYRRNKNWVNYHDPTRPNSSISVAEETSITSPFSSVSSGALPASSGRYFEERKPWKRQMEWVMAALPEENSQPVLKHEREQVLKPEKELKIWKIGYRHSNKW